MGDCLTSAPPGRLEELRRQFRERHHVTLSGFLGSGLVDTVADEIADAEFELQASEGDIGTESEMQPNRVSATLNWRMNAPSLIAAVREVTDCEEIGLFAGRVYRLEPSSGQSFDWHDDLGSTERRVAFSVNLGNRPYSGGVLQIRERRAPDLIAEVSNLAPGDAVLFRLGPHLVHRVTPVEGTVPRVAFAGWFLAGPNYYSSLLRAAAGVAE